MSSPIFAVVGNAAPEICLSEVLFYDQHDEA